MKLVPYNGKIDCGYRKPKNYALIKEFIDSDMECAEVEDFPQKTAYICANGLNRSMKRYNVHTTRAVVRNGRVFLIREEV